MLGVGARLPGLPKNIFVPQSCRSGGCPGSHENSKRFLNGSCFKKITGLYQGLPLPPGERTSGMLTKSPARAIRAPPNKSLMPLFSLAGIGMSGFRWLFWNGRIFE